MELCTGAGEKALAVSSRIHSIAKSLKICCLWLSNHILVLISQRLLKRKSLLRMFSSEFGQRRQK